jgi:hypothetical protein
MPPDARAMVAWPGNRHPRALAGVFEMGACTMSAQMTLGKKLDRMIAELSRLAAVANRGRDFKVALLAQEAINAVGLLRTRGREDADPDWAEWVAWPPQAYPAADEHNCKGLVGIEDVERLKARSEAA